MTEEDVDKLFEYKGNRNKKNISISDPSIKNDSGISSIKTYHINRIGKRNVLFNKSISKEFQNQYLGIPWTDKNLGKNPNINYPDRTHFKKQKLSMQQRIKNIISKIKEALK